MNYDLIIFLCGFLFLFFGIWYAGSFIRYVFGLLSGKLSIRSILYSRRSRRYD